MSIVNYLMRLFKSIDEDAKDMATIMESSKPNLDPRKKYTSGGQDFGYPDIDYSDLLGLNEELNYDYSNKQYSEYWMSESAKHKLNKVLNAISYSFSDESNNHVLSPEILKLSSFNNLHFKTKLFLAKIVCEHLNVLHRKYKILHRITVTQIPFIAIVYNRRDNKFYVLYVPDRNDIAAVRQLSVKLITCDLNDSNGKVLILLNNGRFKPTGLIKGNHNYKVPQYQPIEKDFKLAWEPESIKSQVTSDKIGWWR